MRFRCISYTDERAVVRAEPSWLGRMFGAKATTIELGRVKKPGELQGTFRMTPWVAKGSGRSLDELEDHEAIRHALDFREEPELPGARVAREVVTP